MRYGRPVLGLPITDLDIPDPTALRPIPDNLAPRLTKADAKQGKASDRG